MMKCSRSWLSGVWFVCQVVGICRGDDASRFTGPRPGEVYREVAVHNGGNLDWRVTDPQASAQGAQQFLPNPVLKIEIADLRHAVRVEALLDRWGGHLRTTAKRIRFNGHEWITVPEIAAVPAGEEAEYFYSQDNPVVEIPLAHLREGANTVEGTCGVLDDYNWGQWGLYSVILRVYYDPALKPHATARIVTPADGDTLAENPTVRAQPANADDVARVDVLAWYEGYDENGDGVFRDWHEAYFQPERGTPADLSEHVGTVTRPPYEVTWNTRWVPDQQPKSVMLLARVQHVSGVWSVSPPIEDLSLRRTGTSVRMYRAVDLPRAFGVRAGQEKSCTIRISDADPQDAVEAVLALRTWHGWDGHHRPLRLNGHSFPIGGENHHYDYDLLPVPTSRLQSGGNALKIRSQTHHHMLEVLWPGPALIVRYEK